MILAWIDSAIVVSIYRFHSEFNYSCRNFDDAIDAMLKLIQCALCDDDDIILCVKKAKWAFVCVQIWGIYDRILNVLWLWPDFWNETRYSVQWNYTVHCSFKTLFGCFNNLFVSFKTLFVSFRTLDQMNSSLTVERLKWMFSVCHLYLEAWTFFRKFLWFWISIFNSFLGMTILYDKEIFFPFFSFY